MNKKYKLIIFDIDGTLLESHRGILNALKKTLNRNHLKWPEDKTPIISIIGASVQVKLKEVFPNLTHKQIDMLVDGFRDEYTKDINIYNAKLYPQELKTLAKLKRNGCHLAIVSYKRNDCVQMLYHHFGFDKYCDFALGVDAKGKTSKADAIIVAVKRAKVEPSEVLYVGDTNGDAISSAKAKVDFLAVTYGYGFKTKNDLKNIKCINYVDKFVKILKVIA